jgi:hypothetical protein
MDEKERETVVRRVSACPRCRGGHAGLRLRPFVGRPVSSRNAMRQDLDCTYWGVCPVTLEPVLYRPEAPPGEDRYV